MNGPTLRFRRPTLGKFQNCGTSWTCVVSHPYLICVFPQWS